MKKTIKIYLSSVFMMALLFSCQESDNIIDGVLDDFTTGAVLRTVQVINSDMPLGDDSTSFTIEIEEQDNQEGALLSEVDVYLGFRDNTDDDVDTDVSEVFVETLTTADFAPGPFGLPRTILSYSIVDMRSMLSLSEDIPQGGDQYIFRLELKLTDGRIFSDYNAGGIITGGFFASPFLYSANVTCPFTTSLAETFTYTSYDMGPGDGSGGQQETGLGPYSSTITWTEEYDDDDELIEGLYGTPDFSFGMFEDVWGDDPATNGSAMIKWFCSDLLPEGADQYSDAYTYVITGVSGPTMTIMWNNTWGDIGTVDLTREGNANWPLVFGGDD